MGLLSSDKVLITGSNGFIAQNLSSRLNQEGVAIYGIDITPNRNPNISKNSFFQANLIDRDGLKDIIKKIQPSVVFHLAANMNKDVSGLSESIKTNVLGTLNLIEVLKQTTIRHIVYLETSEIYSDDIPYNETNSIALGSAYSLSKHQAAQLLHLFYEQEKLPVTILRPSVVYGPHQGKGMFIPSIILNLLEGKTFEMTPGEQTRDFIYVGDLTDSMLKVIGNKKVAGEVINIGSGEEDKIKDVAHEIVNIIGADQSKIKYTLQYRPNDQMRYCLDITKAKDILGWTPSTSLDEGLKKTIRWYKSGE